MAVRSAVLYAGFVTVAAQNTLFTVPAGELWIVKDMRVYNESATTCTGFVYTRNPSVSAYGILLDFAIPTLDVLPWSGWVAMAAGHELIVNPSSQPVHLWISGTKLRGSI